ATVWTGELNEDVYSRAASGGFTPPIGVFRWLEFQSASTPHPDRYILTDVEGRRQIFETPAGWPRSDRVPLVRIEDRHGNGHLLTYDPEGRLERVTDHAGRFLWFQYGECGLLEKVSDHTGRTWSYTHDDDIEHLIAVTTPATANAPGELISQYDYDRTQTHPALAHNIIRVTEPGGRVVVENTYGDDPGTYDFGRVVAQS